jgi:hypothetical protein
MTQNIVHQLGVDVLALPGSAAAVHQVGTETMVKHVSTGTFQQVGIEVFIEWPGAPPAPISTAYARLTG